MRSNTRLSIRIRITSKSSTNSIEKSKVWILINFIIFWYSLEKRKSFTYAKITPLKSEKCYACHADGHIAKDCPIGNLNLRKCLYSFVFVTEKDYLSRMEPCKTIDAPLNMCEPWESFLFFSIIVKSLPHTHFARLSYPSWKFEWSVKSFPTYTESSTDWYSERWAILNIVLRISSRPNLCSTEPIC